MAVVGSWELAYPLALKLLLLKDLWMLALPLESQKIRITTEQNSRVWVLFKVPSKTENETVLLLLF